jgi:hypothetical protein
MSLCFRGLLHNPVSEWELGLKRFSGAGGASDRVGTGGLLLGLEATLAS